ncbi:MAG: tetratricopeptide repeat protein, partial [Cytophagales bacterium]|nr:tetratricopeptide repeat protein [Cytophagales bacterium]
LGKHKAYKGKNYELTTHKDPAAPLLFKLHGCFEEADSMVLFPTNYDNLYANPEPDAEHSLLVLKNIILNKSILFIGTGMGDFQINSIFQEIKKLQGTYNQEHFILTTKTLDSQLDFLTAITIQNHTEISSIIEELIEIKQVTENEESAEIIELKEQLEEAQQTIERLKSTTDKDELLEREAWKYFSRGLEFSLSDHLEEASEQYKTAVELKPDLAEAYFNWGTDLVEIAQRGNKETAEMFFNEAAEKFQKAIEIKPDKHEAWNNWGNTLGHLAEYKEPYEANALFYQAFEKYQKAIEIKQDKHEAWNNWGAYLGKYAETKSGKEAEVLYDQAVLKFQAAVEIKPDYYKAYSNWGYCLISLSRSKTAEAANKILQQAFEVPSSLLP